MPATQISFTAFALAAFADNTRSIAVPGGVDTQQVVSVVLCAPPVTQAASVLVAQPVAADGGECIRPVRRSWLVLVTFDSGLSRSFRWYKRADALRCMRDFGSARKQLFCCYGRLTWDGWRDVSPPLLDRVAV